MNVIGEPIDEKGDISKSAWPAFTCSIYVYTIKSHAYIFPSLLAPLVFSDKPLPPYPS